jgi:N-acetylmuramic acid 6-phosphate (MurNAc-6-P) etherase
MTTTNNNIEQAVTAIQEALKEVKRMNYVLAIKATLIRMLDECERLQALGTDTTEMVNLIQTIFDFTTYITDTPDEVPNA